MNTTISALTLKAIVQAMAETDPRFATALGPKLGPIINKANNAGWQEDAAEVSDILLAAAAK